MSVFSAGLLIQAVSGIARILGSLLVVNRSGVFARAAAKVLERSIALLAASP